MAVDGSLKLLSRRAGPTVLSCAGSLQSAMMAVSSFKQSLTEEKLHNAEQRLQKFLQQIVVIDSQISAQRHYIQFETKAECRVRDQDDVPSLLLQQEGGDQQIVDSVVRRRLSVGK
jgi:hypothetical protein